MGKGCPTGANVSLTKKEQGSIAIWKIITPPLVAEGDGKSPLPNLFLKRLLFVCFYVSIDKIEKAC